MKRLHLSLLTAALVFSMSEVVVAQSPQMKIQPKPSLSKQPETSSPSSPPSSPPFSPTFFSPGVSVVTYLANDPQKVYAWVETQVASVPGKPDQYTTTDERQKYALALAEKMKGMGVIPFIGPCQKKYDPEHQSFEIKILLSSIKDDLLKSPNPEALNLRRLRVAQTNIQNDTYTAQNAHGATTEVSRTVSDEYVLTFPSGPKNEPASVLIPGSMTSSVRLPYRYIFNFLALSAKLAPAEARENDKQIACLYDFSLEPPYTFKFKEREIPTRDLPFERTTNGHALFGRLDQVAVIHKVTGQIYDQAARIK